MAEQLHAWRAALEDIIGTLRNAHYPFASEIQYGVPPMAPASSESLSALDWLERHGPLPPIFRNLVETIGTVDLRHGAPHDPDAPCQALACLDPFVFDFHYVGLCLDEQEVPERALNDGSLFIEFAPDIYHKADVSGGEGYGFDLPINNPQDLAIAAPPSLPGLQDTSQARPSSRVSVLIRPALMEMDTYLDAVLSNGGFFGFYTPPCEGSWAGPEGRYAQTTAIAKRDRGNGQLIETLRAAAGACLGPA